MAGYYLTRHVVQPDIGLAAEAIAHHKDKKAQERDIEESMAPSQTLEDQNSDQELKESVSKQAAASEPFELSFTLSKVYGPKKTTVRAYLKKNLSGISGKTGEAQMPEPAELIYPALDNGREEKGKSPNRFTRSRQFFEAYMDKRAQSRFAANNPDSILTHELEFESSMGSLGTRHQHTGRGGPIGAPLSRVVEEVSKGKYKGRDANPIVIATRAIRPKILYLMVTQLPTEEEMRIVRQYFDVKEMSWNEIEEYEREENVKNEVKD